MLEGAEARHGVERPEALASDLPRICEVDVEVMAPAGGQLGGGERDAHPAAAPAANEVEQGTPTAAEVEHPPARADPDLLGHVLMLACLRLLEAQREIAVVLRPAEVGQLSKAEPEDAVSERVGEVEIVAVGHVISRLGPRRYRARSGSTRPGPTDNAREPGRRPGESHDRGR